MAGSVVNELPLNQILLGDCVELLKPFPENSIDLVVTDPPYGLSFMGKDWDKTLPPRAAFEEIIRVLKPGALAFVMSSPRQDLLWRMLAMLEGVGFELTQSYIDWIYRTGFPKAYDVSSGIDRKFIVEEFLEAEGRKPTKDELKELIKEKKEVIGEKLLWGHNAGTGAGSFSKNRYEGQVGVKRTEPILAPASDLAKKWDGWKSQTGLKPAHEPILMLNKAFSESTIVDNVLKWNTGAINVDATRIPFQNKTDSEYVETKHDSAAGIPREGGNTYQWKDYKGERTDGFTQKGRFPANMLVTDKALDLVGRQDEGRGHTPKRGDTGGLYEGGFGVIVREEQHFKDSGGLSRFFDLDAWAKHHGFLDVPKPDNKERDFGLKGKKRIPTSKLNLSGGKNPVRLDGVISKPRRNIHPTVKPIKLMAYLIELGCPPGGVVLDPFVGTGTTCIAAKQLVRRFIGIEINPEYHALAVARVAAHPVPLSWL